MVKRIKGIPTADDLVQRKLARSEIAELLVSDVTEHPTREGKVKYRCVLDSCCRRSVGSAIDSFQHTNLVAHALDKVVK
jgi:hypothetical protein